MPDKDIQYLYDRGMFSIKLGLENIRNLLKYYKIDIDKIKTVHIAGTNGKGSVSSMTAQIMTENGYRTGLFTSPHLVSFNERFRIDGEMIADKDLSGLITYLKEGIEKFNCTFFEASTAIGFKYFIDNDVDIAVIEAGLGGRLDSTNVITPVVSVITGVDIDHTAHLGNTAIEIAREKAGIIKKGIPVIYNTDKPEVEEVIINTAEENSSIALKADKNDLNFKNGKVSYNYDKGSITACFNLNGEYQKVNFSTVVKILESIKDMFPVDENKTVKAIENFHIKGRMETLSTDPNIIIDAAHNIQGLNELQKYSRVLKKKIHLITGTVKDKDYNSTIKKILEFDADIYFTGSDNSRILDAGTIKQICENTNADRRIEYFDHVYEGFEKALKNYRPGDTILITGSHYILGDLLEYYEKNRLNNEKR